ncbi:MULTISPECIES: FG-GAP repeat domain-containing protein [Thermomonosporaceae]|uniref:FG-GAP repeat domain-containing protein n=1 Tax=Thermomonosporaceae TaxID=2012 RepID=UPI00255B0114|nr:MULTISPECIES: VCBS repeat-containing protein [Thermomonosporaceae]MDL4771246.1 VCBS repeat-containing protein [Actinomadura xylanilytica]
MTAVALTQDGGQVEAAPVAAAGKTTAVSGDFNGDGLRDSANASQQGKIDGQDLAGFVTVVYSKPGGPDAASRQIISAKSLGLPAGTHFGTMELVSADFDGDGYADLVATSGIAAKTKVVIVYGGAKGLTTRKAVLTVPDAREARTGDFNGNGRPDLLVRSGPRAYLTYLDVGAKPGAGVRTAVEGPAVTGLLQPVVGDFNGDRRDDFAVVVAKDDGDSDDVPYWAELRLGTAKGLGARKVYAPKGGKGMGYEAASGDVNGDGKADLVTVDVRAPKRVAVRLGTATGLAAPAYVGFGGHSFNRGISVGDINGDGKADVSVSVPTMGDGNGPLDSAAVLYGSASGLTNKGAQLFDQNTPGVPSEPGDHDGFGWQTRLADLDGDGLAEFTTGAQNNEDEGRIFFFKGTRSGVATKGVISFSTRDLRIFGRTAELGGSLLH